MVYMLYQRQETLDLPYLTLLCDKFEKVNVPPKLFILTLFWELVMFFQLKTSFHYFTDRAKVYAPKNKTSRGGGLIFSAKSALKP
jgi:hypothetical protein